MMCVRNLVVVSVWIVQLATSVGSNARFSGCLFSSSLCRADEYCFDDNLFGTCGTSGLSSEIHHYELSGQQLAELESMLQQLIAGGFTWRDLYTQCILSKALLAYRNGLLLGTSGDLCQEYVATTWKYRQSSFHSPSVVEKFGNHYPSKSWTKSIPGMDMWNGTYRDRPLKRPSPASESDSGALDFRTKSGLRQAYREFAEFMKELSPDDLRNLKEYLLEESLSRNEKISMERLHPEEKMPTEAKATDGSAGTTVTSPDDMDSKQLRDLTNSSQRTSPATDAAEQRTEDVASKATFLSHHEGIAQIKYDSRARVTLYALFGALGILTAVFIITCFQYCRTYQSTRNEKLARMNRDPHYDDYEDLWRQHMTSKLSEVPETLQSSEETEMLWDHQDVLRTSLPSGSGVPTWKEELVVDQIDLSTAGVVLTYMEQHLQDANRLQREWDDLCAAFDDVDPTHFSPAAYEPNNVRKNRSADILPFEKTRVKLNVESNLHESDYINASSIIDDDPGKPLYIATQGPLGNTVTDFWQMIWEQGSVVIVNLTCLTEDSVPMCCRYWPENCSDRYHIFEVTIVSEHGCCDDYAVRNLLLRNLRTAEVRNITLFHFLSWSGRSPGIPESVQGLLEFRRRVNKSFRSRAPTVVHCSDGAGRTGTYCLIDMVLNRVVKGAKQVDMAATVEHLRDQRHGMVQTKEQFEFALSAVAQEVHSMMHLTRPTTAATSRP